LAPADYLETKKATIAASQIKGPVYLRFARHDSPVFTVPKTPFKIGRANILIKGNDITIIACGPLVYEAILAAKELAKQKIKAEVINNHTIKPLDNATILKSVHQTKCLVTVEDHQANGGLGSAVAEMLAKKYPVPIEMIGVQDSFGESGTVEQLWKKYKLTHPFIIKAALKVLKRK